MNAHVLGILAVIGAFGAVVPDAPIVATEPKRPEKPHEVQIKDGRVSFGDTLVRVRDIPARDTAVCVDAQGVTDAAHMHSPAASDLARAREKRRCARNLRTR